MAPVRARTLEQVRALSEKAFGAPYRLEIIASIHWLPGEAFTTGELQATLDEPLNRGNNASRNLKSLAEAGLLRKVQRGLWSRVPSPVWEHVAGMVDDFLEQEEGT